MLDWENSHHFAMQPLASQQNIASEEWLQIFYIDEVTFPYLGSASDWLKQNSLTAQPIRNTTQIWVVTCHQSIEFPQSFLRCHFAGKPVVAS